MNNSIKQKINIFEAKRKQSIFCKISLNDNEISWEKCISQNCFPYAFILNEDGNLEKIDNLIKKFEIEKRGSQDFKNRLKDKMSGDIAVDLNSYNAIESALIELLVADFLSSNERIVDLAAWGCDDPQNNRPDIKSQDITNNITYSTEVKYLGQIPELIFHLNDQIRNNNLVSSCWLPDIYDLYTYLNMRMVDAICQLSLVCGKRRRCFIVLKSSIASNNNIIKAVRDKIDWNDDKLTALCNRLSLCKGKYLVRKISDWQKELGYLVIAYLNPSYTICEKLNSKYLTLS